MAAIEPSVRRWISPREAAGLLGVHIQTLYLMASRGQIPAARLGRKVLIDRRRLEADLEAQISAGGAAVTARTTDSASGGHRWARSGPVGFRGGSE